MIFFIYYFLFSVYLYYIIIYWGIKTSPVLHYFPLTIQLPSEMSPKAKCVAKAFLNQMVKLSHWICNCISKASCFKCIVGAALESIRPKAHLSCCLSQPTQRFGRNTHTIPERWHVSRLTVLWDSSHGLPENLFSQMARCVNIWNEHISLENSGMLWWILYLGILHYALNAVKIREIADRLIGIVQHSSNSLCVRGRGTG